MPRARRATRGGGAASGSLFLPLFSSYLPPPSLFSIRGTTTATSGGRKESGAARPAAIATERAAAAAAEEDEDEGKLPSSSLSSSSPEEAALAEEAASAGKIRRRLGAWTSETGRSRGRARPLSRSLDVAAQIQHPRVPQQEARAGTGRELGLRFLLPPLSLLFFFSSSSSSSRSSAAAQRARSNGSSFPGPGHRLGHLGQSLELVRRREVKGVAVEVFPHVPGLRRERRERERWPP